MKLFSCSEALLRTGFELGSQKHTTEVVLKNSGALNIVSRIQGLSFLRTTKTPHSPAIARTSKMAFSTGRRSLTTFISRALSHKLSPSSPSLSSSRTRFALAALSHPPSSLIPTPLSLSTRFNSTGGHSPLNDPAPNWSNRPPKETILLDGCDYEHWLVILEWPDSKPSRDEMINAYVETLAKVVGSEEEARKKIYSVSTTTYTGFGCLISEELSYKVKELPGVLWVLPDSYLDVPNKDYGGDLYVDGQITRRPQYDFSQREPAKARNRPRHDNRRESRPVERRGPPQSKGSNQTQQQRTPISQAEASESTGA